MSQDVRQNTLFAAEDFTKVYKSFQNINFTAYDFDTIKNSLIDYVRIQFPEDFNDYIESSEFIAIIELLSYLGTSLAFRVDLNSRENIMDTAQRRESIIRLARLINYQPKRNIAARGLFKIVSLSTTQPLTDSVGNSIANTNVFWGDPNNPDWFDQFVTISNAAFQTTNPFGRPSKSGTVGSIPTDLYALNNVLRLNVTQPISINVNGEQIPIDICNPNFDETFFERQPDPSESFNFIYRNDGQGVSSINTGFFLYFRQGQLVSEDYRYDFPQPNRIQQLSRTDINQSDVYVQEIDEDGEVIQQWMKVPAVNGTNVIYNSINFQERDIFEVISEVSDSVSVKFPDGNFGNVPTGIIRYWVRPSIGRNIIIRPEDAQLQQITIPYVGVDNQIYGLVVTFSLQYTVANGAASETDTQIKERAPQTFYTQERMINNEDYNVFPLVYGNEITKLRAINRTYSGNSRYINVNDPTGFHQDLTLIADDGAIYNEPEDQRMAFEINNNIIGLVSDVVMEKLQDFMQNVELRNFFYNNYLDSFATQFGENYFDLTPVSYWKTSPDTFKNDTGFLIKSLDETLVPDWPYGPTSGSSYTNIQSCAPNNGAYSFVKSGAILTFATGTDAITVSTSVDSVANNGMAYDTAITLVGPIELGSDINDLLPAASVIPNFRSVFNANDPVAGIVDRINATGLFGLGYDVIKDLWYIVDISDNNAAFGLKEDGGELDDTYAPSWLVTVDTTKTECEFVSRGTVTVFQSLKQLRFYWDPERKVYDSKTGNALYDQIEVLPWINNSTKVETCVCDGVETTRPVPLDKSIIWTPAGLYLQADGYQDTSKIEILPSDLNEDGVADYPTSFNDLVTFDDEVVMEKYINTDGYELTQPWIAPWNDVMLSITDVSTQLDIELDGANSDANASSMGFIVTVPGNPSAFVPLSAADLFLAARVDIGVTVPDRVAELLTEGLNYIWNSPGTDPFPDTRANAKKFVTYMQDGKTIRNGNVGTDISGQNYYNFLIVTTDVETYVESIIDKQHFGYNGVSFNQNTLTPANENSGLTFKWKHYAPADQRIDPSASNIIDMIVLTNSYYDEVVLWKNENKSNAAFPLPPTTEELRIQFSDLDAFKSISDAIVYNSGTFKVLFGSNASPELQATFKAIKLSTSTISDNELKTRVIQAVDAFFEINNWDFGERFFYTELAAYIHATMSTVLSSIVIVPKQEEAQFGDLFEIVARPTELFLSTATVANVELVSNYTETNLRV